MSESVHSSGRNAIQGESSEPTGKWYPIGFGREINPRGSFTPLRIAGGTAIASLIATGMLAATNQDSPEKLDLRWQSTTLLKPEKTTTVDIVSVPAPKSESRSEAFSVDAATMPDVPSFNLAATPEAQIINNMEAFTAYQDTIASKIREGWTVTKVEGIGGASDETRLEDTAGIGNVDEKNVKLAQAYGEFVSNAFTEGMKERGVEINPELVTSSAKEHVLTPEQVEQFETLRDREGAATNLELIKKLKADRDSLNPATVQALEQLLETRRGSELVLTLQSPEGDIQTESLRCIETTTITRDTQKHDNHVPLMIVPFTIPKIRRKNKFTEEPVEPQQPTPDDDNLASVTHIGRKPNEESESLSEVQVKTHKQLADEAYNDVIKRERWAKRFKRVGAALAGLAAVGAVFIRGDVSNCPNPDDFSSKFKWGEWPAAVEVKLHVPGTDIDVELGKVTIKNTCIAPNQADPKAGFDDCDERVVKKRDGKVIQETETHRSGAVKTVPR